MDLLFQAYFMGLLWLLSNANFNVGNPYNTSRTQIGFGTFGGPHITSLLAEVSGYALRAQWFQKYWVHRALRPEAYGGLVHYTKTAAASYPLHSDVLNSQALAGIFEKNNGTYFLPIAFPEGSPTHPSYGSGHATVAGACVTVLKAFFNTDNVAFPNPMVSAPDGLSLTSYTGADAGQITLTGELNKLANNIAQARNIAGLHWRSDATQAILLGRPWPSAFCETKNTPITRPSRGSHSRSLMAKLSPYKTCGRACAVSFGMMSGARNSILISLWAFKGKRPSNALFAGLPGWNHKFPLNREHPDE